MTETARVDEFAAALENKGYGSESLDNDTFARLVLTTINGTSNGDVGHLVADHGAYEALRLLLDADDDELDAANLRPIAEAQRAGLREVGLVTKAITDALRLQYVGSIELLTPEHDHWPQKVGDLRSAQPLLLWARGDTEALNNWRTTSIVGARAATGYGEHVAMEMAADLTFRGQAIVNGGAYGIEGMALRASLAGDGTPIAIMAGGLDRLYPSGHQALLERVADKGVIISEQMPTMAPSRWGFQQANRLKAALSHSTIVVEAGARSGAMHAATQAQLLGRFVGAVPGPVTSAASAGCHQLIKDGTAMVVTAVTDIPAVATDPSTGPMRRQEFTRTATVAHEAPEHDAAPTRSN